MLYACTAKPQPSASCAVRFVEPLRFLCILVENHAHAYVKFKAGGVQIDNTVRNQHNNGRWMRLINSRQSSHCKTSVADFIIAFGGSMLQI